MKKFFTLIAAVAMAASVNAQSTLINYPASTEGITLNGTTVYSTVKIHNKDAINGIKMANGYTTEEKINSNYCKLTVAGGFKTGDIVTIAGAFNNSDNTKESKATFFIGEEGGEPSTVFTTAQFINGKTVDADPVDETYTLEKDYDYLLLGRTGKAATFVTKLVITRGTSTGITNISSETSAKSGAIYNLAGQQVSKDYKGVVIQNGKKFVNK